jgi:ribonuclease HI
LSNFKHRFYRSSKLLIWVPSHNDISGNKKADTMAKKAITD